MIWHVDRKLFDRSGWEVLSETYISSTSGNNTRNGINVNNIQSFINNHHVLIPNEPPSSPFRYDFEEFLSDYDADQTILTGDEEDEEDEY